jgi:hypothetical protein
MWIIPRQSRFSAFAAVTPASKLDWPEHWRTLCESLLWRSRHTPWRYWKRRLRKASWLSRLCGRTCEPSRQSDFEAALISSWPVFLVSPSRLPDYAEEPKTSGTCGRILSESSTLWDLAGSCSKTSPDSSRRTPWSTVRSFKSIAEDLRDDWEQHLRLASWLDSPDTQVSRFSSMSCTDWRRWVIRARLDFLARQNSARPTSGNGCSCWPTPAAANYRDGKASPETMARNSRPLQEVVISGPPDPASPSTNGKPPEQWLTPHGFMGQDQDGTYGGGGEFAKQVKQWGSPRVTTNSGSASPQSTGKGSRLEDQVGKRTQKLNPDWVESLMNLPVHWTRP